MLSVLEKRPNNVLKVSQSDTRSVTSLGGSQDVILIINHKIGFYGNFSIFPHAKCRSCISQPKEVKNLIRFFQSYYGPGRLDQNRTIKGYPQDVWLGSLILLELTIFPKMTILNKIRDKSITHNIFTIQDNDSIMCGFYSIAFKEYMLAGKSLLDYTNLFFPYNYERMIR